MTRSELLPILFGLFTAAVVMTNAVSVNLIEVGPFVFVAGTLLYPATFLLTDVISEVYGERAATRAVWTGFTAQALSVVAVFWLAMWPSLDPEVDAHWRAVFLPIWRISAASMVAYLVAQLVDVRVFHALKGWTEGRHLWLRNNASTIASQGIDSAIFVIIAFLGVLDTYSLAAMWLGQWAAKAILAALDTPLCYLAVAAVHRLPED